MYVTYLYNTRKPCGQVCAQTACTKNKENEGEWLNYCVPWCVRTAQCHFLSMSQRVSTNHCPIFSTNLQEGTWWGSITRCAVSSLFITGYTLNLTYIYVSRLILQTNKETGELVHYRQTDLLCFRDDTFWTPLLLFLCTIIPGAHRAQILQFCFCSCLAKNTNFYMGHMTYSHTWSHMPCVLAALLSLCYSAPWTPPLCPWWSSWWLLCWQFSFPLSIDSPLPALNQFHQGWYPATFSCILAHTP